jgi:hypothetical protein
MKPEYKRQFSDGKPWGHRNPFYSRGEEMFDLSGDLLSSEFW